MLGSIAALAAPRSTARRPVRGASGSSAADEASAHTANIRSTVHRFVDDLEANSKTCVLVFIRGLHPAQTLLARAQL